MKIEKARDIIKDAKVRVCRHHPRLVLSPSESKVFISVQAGSLTPNCVVSDTGLALPSVRSILSNLFSRGYLNRSRPVDAKKPTFGAPQYRYEVVKWVPNEI